MVSLTFFYTKSVYNVWMYNPVLMYNENTKTGIHEIPFPKLMICPFDQLRKSVWEKHRNTNTSYW